LEIEIKNSVLQSDGELALEDAMELWQDRRRNAGYLLTPWSRVLLEKLNWFCS